MLPDLKNYQIIEELGRGGMATVYKAWQPSLSREVALKVLPPYFAHDEELLLRFRYEARAVAKLRHPHIVQVFDFHQEGDWFYLAMEFIGGGSLQQKLASAGRLDSDNAVRLIAQVAEGLHHAHEKGFIHRDIKPSNILLTDEGQAVITDFGIVKALEGPGFTSTANGGMGTSEYMSPEQSKGQPIGRQTDLYSLGAVFYEMLVGSPPFGASSPMAVLHSQIYDDPIEPSQKNPNVDVRIERIIMKLLAKDPSRRFASGLDLVAALTCLTDKPTLVRRDTRVAKAVPVAKKEDLRPEISGSPVGADPQSLEPAKPGFRIGAAVVAMLALAVSWSAGFFATAAFLPVADSPIKVPKNTAAASSSRSSSPEKHGVKNVVANEKKKAAVSAAAETSSTSTALVQPPPTQSTETPATTPEHRTTVSKNRRSAAPAAPPAPLPQPQPQQEIPIIIQ